MTDSKEIKQARIIQRSLTNNGIIKKREPDFKKPYISEIIPDIVELRNVDPNNGAQCCLKCRNERRRIPVYMFGDPDKGGKGGPIIWPLPDCGCKAKEDKEDQERAERRERKARLSKAYRRNIIASAIVNATFQNWRQRPGTERAYESAKQFSREFDTRTLGLLFTGDPGNGKSHLARAIQQEAEEREWVTLFLDWPQLVELAKATFGVTTVSIADIIRGAVDADLLVFDEIGAGKLTDWEFKTLLFPILNGRTGKKTVATTNLNLQELENWFLWGRPEGQERSDSPQIDAKGRLFDRVLGNFQIVKNNGTSKRREDALARKQG